METTKKLTIMAITMTLFLFVSLCGTGAQIISCRPGDAARGTSLNDIEASDKLDVAGF
ncbi:MAG: hypothetical protein NT061_00305 [Spirochaetes bacterium]|nr:hypothetical protein [Spirochaetota bacterium]